MPTSGRRADPRALIAQPVAPPPERPLRNPQHLGRLLLTQLAPLMAIEQPLKTHLPYPLQQLRPAHRPPLFRGVLKPDRSRATKSGHITRQLQEAARALRRLGVEVRLGAPVTQCDCDGVAIGDERIESRTLIWAAGAAAAPAAWLGITPGRAGRVPVEADLTISGHPDIFVVGDTAQMPDHLVHGRADAVGLANDPPIR